MTRWIFTDIADELSALSPEYQLLSASRDNLLGDYRAFVASRRERDLWISLVGRGSSADDFAKNYYHYFEVCPPHVIVLIEPGEATVYDLNLITCPFLVVHSGKNPGVPAAVYRHQMRYGDPTRELLLEPNARKISDIVHEWLAHVPNFGVAKEGVHARGFAF